MLTTQIREDMKVAMKAREQLRLDTLRMLLSAFTNELVTKGRKPSEELTDEEALAVIKRLVKQRKDSAEQFTKGNRPELAHKEMLEITLLEVYLPTMATRAEIEAMAQKLKSELVVADKSGMGKLMGAVMKALGGNADGGKVKEVVESLF
jgi:uncharacterized protein YqeY